MVTRTYLVGGDKADNGAVIVGGSNSYFWHSKPVAREGDAVYCPVCKRPGVIVCIGPRIPSRDRGKEVALSGDICACGCQPAPVFYASRPFTMTINGDHVTKPPVVVPSGFAATAQALHSGEPASYDQRIQLLDETSGQPLANRRYRLIGESGSHEARTDSNGFTTPVFADRAATVRLEVFGEDA
ncbi:PAAR domain-containing protein [Cupriavidus necator]|uniref:PAAR domain-containing protein n=1 Tax=Cupriavidus necator TaxID=106590 RepID=A0A1U9USC7_CUPNE|nr:PAAR domain-containing protein [Cupriavidus necator]AQV95606.1 PAAR domain-containing protein [Cupriavidus necator]